MKHKLGPLPMWAWVLIAGGTIGIVWYLRTPSPAAVATSNPLDSSLPATSGAPGDPSAGGGGGATATDTGPTTADLMGELLGLEGSITALQGSGQGLTDQQTPLQTWTGEVTDVAGGVTALATLAKIFNPPPAKKTTAQKKKTTAKKRSQGSGAAGKAKDSHKTPIRRTRQHVATKKTPHMVGNHSGHPIDRGAPAGQVVAAPTHKHAGGNTQKRRTAKPKHRHR